MAIKKRMLKRKKMIYNSILLILIEEDESQQDDFRNRNIRRWYIRPEHEQLVNRRFSNLYEYFNAQTAESFFMYSRLYPDEFEMLLCKVAHRLHPKRLSHRYPLNAREKLLIALRYLSHGSSSSALSGELWIGASTVRKCVKDVCEAILAEFRDDAFPTPSLQMMEECAKGFAEEHGYPRACLALDGKHCRIQNPAGGGSSFFNYKSFHSIVLLAAVDPFCRCVMYDLGAPGRNSDSSVYNSSSIRSVVCNQQIFPRTHRLGSVGEIPYAILIDQGFALTERTMRPYSQVESARCARKARFNEKLSSARRVVENYFGLLQSRFKIFQTPLKGTLDGIRKEIETCMVLHNLLAYRVTSVQLRRRFAAPTVNNLQNIRLQPNTGNATARAKHFRNRIAEYFDQTQ